MTFIEALRSIGFETDDPIDGADVIDVINKYWDSLVEQDTHRWESISERCRRTHCQCCHICEDMFCCDNTSSGKTIIIKLIRLIRSLRGNNACWCDRYYDPMCGHQTHCRNMTEYLDELEQKGLRIL